MNSWLIGLLLILTVILISLFLNIFINIIYLKKPGHHFVSISISIFRRLKLYTLKISPEDFLNRHLETKADHETKKSSKKPSAEVSSDCYYKLIGKILKFTHFEKLYLKMVYGFEDAALTGISAGILEILKGNFLALFYNYLKITQRPEFCIVPVYGYNKLEVEFNCILKIRVGNVIKIMAGA